MEETQKIDQSALAESIDKKLNMLFADQFLVKPLDPIKVKKEFTKLPEKTPTTDKDGVSAIDVTDNDAEVKEIKEVDSDFRKGIVISLPESYLRSLESMPFKIKVGDTVVYRDRAGISFDLLKDSKLLRLYEITAVCK